MWPIYDGYDIYRANADGSNLRPLTMTAGYDAEATIGSAVVGMGQDESPQRLGVLHAPAAKFLGNGGSVSTGVVVQSQQEVVAAFIASFIATASDEMPDRIERKRRVIAKDRADEEPPDQAAQPSEQVTRRSQNEAGNPVVALEPLEFLKPTQVTDRSRICRYMVSGEDPADVCPPKRVEDR